MWDRRRPSSALALLRWHHAYMRGDAPERHDSDPQAGWYKMRLTKGGPFVPVEIWCEQITDEAGELCQPERLRADIYGEEERDPIDIWTHIRPISRAEFTELCAWRDRNVHRYDSRQAIDLAAAPTMPEG